MQAGSTATEIGSACMCSILSNSAIKVTELTDYTASSATTAISEIQCKSSGIAANKFYGNLEGLSTSATYSSTANYAKAVTWDNVSSKPTYYAASLSTSATYAKSAANAAMADQATNAATASYAKTSDSADSASKATSATSATYSSTANYAKATDSANKATSATSASYASTAEKAYNAATAAFSHNANYSTFATTANYATNSGTANFSSFSSASSFASSAALASKTVTRSTTYTNVTVENFNGNNSCTFSSIEHYGNNGFSFFKFRFRTSANLSSKGAQSTFTFPKGISITHPLMATEGIVVPNFTSNTDNSNAMRFRFTADQDLILYCNASSYASTQDHYVIFIYRSNE
jgi:hypothetical protein